jgi:aminobenzoyl-glutamate utilization protein A
MDANVYQAQLVSLRRELHRKPEIGWSEFTTTARIIGLLREYGFEVLAGPKVIKREEALGREPKVVAAGLAYARANGVSEALLAEMEELTGCAGIWRTGRPGPVVAVRFDIDCIGVQESTAPDHFPAQTGFVSERPGFMHACGHDGHMAIGLTLARWISENSDKLNGTIKLLFQPAEEGVRGAAAMAASGIVDDVDFFLGAHLGMMAQTTGEIIPAPTGFLCTTKFDVRFRGKAAHAGVEPHLGRNALAAACHAVTQLLGISRHGGGMTRINIGRMVAGEGRNVIPTNAELQLEVRGETAEINAYMVEQFQRIIAGIATSFGVETEIEKMGEAADLNDDAALAEVITEVARATPSVKKITATGNFGGSEDATILARRVQAHGGQADYFVIGSHHKAGHHQPDFDIEEASLSTGFDVYKGLLQRLTQPASAKKN